MANSSTATISNDDILNTLHDLMQMVADGFNEIKRDLGGKIDKLEHNFNKQQTDLRDLKQIVHGHSQHLQELKQIAYRHDRQLSELAELAKSTYEEELNIHVDIKEILDRLDTIEERLPTMTEAEFRKLQSDVQAVIEWIEHVSKTKHIPVKFPVK